MKARINPFTPTFGKIPPRFAGRRRIIEDVMIGLEAGPGDPNRASLFVGARGSGKTALMTKIAEKASQKGWISVNVTAKEGLLADILEDAYTAAENYIEKDPKSRVTGVKLGGLSIKREFVDRPEGNWRTRMTRLLEALAQESIGLLITVDEVEISDEVRELVIVFQHFVREEREVVLLMAGLPQNVSGLLTDGSISFLRRAAQHHLGPIHEEHEVREAIRKTVELSERTIEEPALELTTSATGGFPFLIQLVGFHVWRQNPQSDVITIEDAKEGIHYARGDMDTRIIKVTLDELSDGDMQFLLAMVEDEDDSQVSNIAERIGRDTNYTNQYRLRLIEQGVIASRGRGKVGFEMPMLKDYLLRNHRL